MADTPKYHLPYPAQTDKLTSGAASIEALATAVETNLKVVSDYTLGGRATLTLNNVANASVAVTFPAGRFSVVPAISATFNGGSIYFAAIAASSPTGMTVNLRSYNDTKATSTLYADWIAVDTSARASLRVATRSATVAPASDPALITRTLMCHTVGCFNAGKAIKLAMPKDVTHYSCGVCAKDITDVA